MAIIINLIIIELMINSAISLVTWESIKNFGISLITMQLFTNFAINLIIANFKCHIINSNQYYRFMISKIAFVIRFSIPFIIIT